MSAEYTVRLGQVFQGPMDLLLHLVREQEVDIHEVELGAVCDGFLAYLKALESLDVEVAADFLVMAATLMSIKARSLLPTEEVDLEAELDPRDELIQRLIEYRRFKGAAGDLDQRLAARNRIVRHAFRPRSEEEPTLDLAELSKWDLLSTFSRLMRETLADRAMRIESDERPMRWYVGRLVGWVKARETLTLRELLAAAADESPSKAMLIGTFCALLELMKLGVVTAHRPEPGAADGDPEGDVRIALKPEHKDDIEEIVRTSGFEDETPDETPRGLEASDTTPAAEGGPPPDGPGDGRPAFAGPHSPPPDDDAGPLEALEDPREAPSGGYEP